MRKYEKVIIIDDNAHTLVKKFIQDGGLEYLEKKLDIKSAVAVIMEKKGSEFNMYNAKQKVRNFALPTLDGIPHEVVKGILEEINAKGQKILLLCDWDWKVNLRGKTMEESLEKMVTSFEGARDSDNNIKRYDEMEIIFYTTLLSDKKIKIPKAREHILIAQKAILGWSWRDPTSSIYRVKKILEYSDDKEKNEQIS